MLQVPLNADNPSECEKLCNRDNTCSGYSLAFGPAGTLDYCALILDTYPDGVYPYDAFRCAVKKAWSKNLLEANTTQVVHQMCCMLVHGLPGADLL